RERGLVGRVHLFPDIPHAQVANFFRAASLFVLPSRQEPFGIVLLEAGAFGLPVVASRVGGIPEILTDGATGRLVAPGDAEELAASMRSVLTDRVTSVEMGERLRRHVFSRFAWTTAYEKYIALLEEAKETESELQSSPSPGARVSLSNA